MEKGKQMKDIYLVQLIILFTYLLYLCQLILTSKFACIQKIILSMGTKIK